MQGVFAFSSGANGFPCPFPLPFRGDFKSATFGTAFGGAAAALAPVGAAGAAFAGTAGAFGFGAVADFLGVLRDCSMDLALVSSLSLQPKTLAAVTTSSQSLGGWIHPVSV